MFINILFRVGRNIHNINFFHHFITNPFTIYFRPESSQINFDSQFALNLAITILNPSLSIYGSFSHLNSAEFCSRLVVST